MKLVDVLSSAEITLPSLLWEDELKWTPSVAKETYTMSGALIIESATRLAGRPITLVSPQDDMAWATRQLVESLRAWATPSDRRMKLVLEYPGDAREFFVTFRHSASAIEATPVKGFPSPSPMDWFKLTIRLIEVQ